MQLPVKYILLGTNPQYDTYILELKIVPITSELQLVIAVHKLKTKITPALVQSFSANDSNIDYFDKLSKTQVISISLSAKQSETCLFSLYETLQKSINSTNLVVADFKSTPELKMNLTPQQVFACHTFINQFVVNYFYYKTEFFREVQVSQPQQTGLNPQVDRPILSIVNKEENNQTQVQKQDEILLNNSDEMNLDVLLSQALSFSSHNLMSYYLVKYINLYLSQDSIENEYDISINNNILTISIEPLISNNLLIFSDKHYNDLITVISKINISIEEINQKMIMCFNQILFICQKIIGNPTKFKNDMHILIKLYSMLFFIYTMRHNPANFNNYIMNASNRIYGLYYTIHAFNQHYFNKIMEGAQYKSLPFNKIMVIHPMPVTYSNTIQKDKLKEAISKNKYILDLKDSAKFIDMVIMDLADNTKNNKKEVKLSLNNGTMINIDQLIDINSNNINPHNIKNSMMQYQRIDASKYNILNKIISIEYLELLRLKLNEPTLISSELSPLTAKYGHIISDTILPKLGSEIDKTLKSPISTLLLLTDFIRPNLSDNSSIETELKILYKFIIPFLYDIFNITEFIDHFH